MRFIDGHAVMESLQKATSNAVKPDFAKGLLEAQRLTINAPTIDAVEVVRCKDCRYFKKIVERSDSGLCYRDLVASAWKENGYCSRGLRREEGKA